MSTYACPPSRRQSGAALLVMLLLVLMVSSYSLLRQLNQSNLSLPRHEKTRQALAEAKQALIAHAIAYGEGHLVNADPTGSTVENDVTLPPGTLPCPEQSIPLGREGVESGQCGARDAAAIGRLPWRSLGIDPLRDGDGECLWYAVSGSFKANEAPHLLNSDSVGQFEIRDINGNRLAGNTETTRAVAVVFAPGAPLSNQNRSGVAGADHCGGNYAASNYLESITIGSPPSTTVYNNAAPDTTAGATSTFIAGTNDQLNDQLIYLTASELFTAAIEKRHDLPTALYDATDLNGQGTRPALAQKVAAMLARYGRNNADAADKRLPWATRLDVSDFANDKFDDLPDHYAGHPPFRVGTSRTATDNALVPSGCSSASDNCRLLIVDRAGSDVAWWRVAGKPLYSPTHTPAAEQGLSLQNSPGGWWDRWKDHLFYVVSPEFSPAAPGGAAYWTAHPNPCTDPGNRCVTVNGKRFAAVVIFAGSRQAGQQRSTLTQRQTPSNYLEGTNPDAFSNPTTVLTRNLGAAGNDQVVCIRADTLAIDSGCKNGT